MVSAGRGPRRQVDIRRAISTAYYGVFHYILASAADELIGASRQKTGRYRLLYRSIDHRTLSTICGDVRKSPVPPRYHPYVPTNGFGHGIKAFSFAFRELQFRRHLADYDPGIRFKLTDAEIVIRMAKEAVDQFRLAPEAERKDFLTLLVCPPR